MWRNRLPGWILAGVLAPGCLLTLEPRARVPDATVAPDRGGVDAGHDAPDDARGDAPADLRPFDAPDAVSIDVPADRPRDVTPDVALDIVRDVGVDVRPDVPVVAGPSCPWIPSGTPCRCTVHLPPAGGFTYGGPGCTRSELGTPAVRLGAEPTLAVAIDMTGHTSLQITMEICSPTGWVWHLGDSPSNNGNGGDLADTVYDAELQYVMPAVAGTYFGAFLSDVRMAGEPTPIYTDSAFVDPAGCTTRTIQVGDSVLAICDQSPSVVRSNPALLRLNPPAVMGGASDALWYLGLNRMQGDAMRTGTGLRAVELCFR